MMEIKETSRFLLTLTVVFSVSVTCLDFKYHSHDELADYLKNFTNTHKNFFSRLYSIGKSIKGRDLWVVEISAYNESKPATPNVKLIGNIHGNEPVGRELLLHFLEYLAEEYKSNNETIRWILENTRLHILPSMNPDGFEMSHMGVCLGENGRPNANNIDLNRNFPDLYKPSVISIQPETLAVQRWMQHIPFILSASLHGGALVANYPYDTVKEQKWEKLLKDLSNATTTEEELKIRQEYIESTSNNSPSLTPDDDVFIHLAKTYSKNHPSMHMGFPCPDSNITFNDGITNGAEWYSIRGGMQDYNYFRHGCMELTLEISCCKHPLSKKLPKLWLENYGALIHFVMQANRGVSGQILDQETKKPVSFASLKIVGRDMNFTSTRNGEFWRILLPGSYRLEVQAWGYHSKRTAFTVLKSENKFPTHTYVPVFLRSLVSRKDPTTHIPLPTDTPTIPPITNVVPEAETESTMKMSSTTPIIKEYSPTNTTEEKTLVQKEALNSSPNVNFSDFLFVAIFFINIKVIYF